MLGYLFGLLAACANAAASVLQRKANREEPPGREMSLRLVVDLLHKPVWFAGVGAVIAGFLLQAAGLSQGQLATVEPLLILELPLTIVLAWRVFGGSVPPREWAALAGMTLGLAGLIWCLSPTGGSSRGVPWWLWLVALVGSFGVQAALVVVGNRTERGLSRAGIYGVATGIGFGTTAALMKGVTDVAANGIGSVFTAWQTYLMVLAGVLSMYLFQNAVNAGALVAAQPGITLSDPVVSIVWGVLVFDEEVRGGIYIVLAVASFALMVASVVALGSSSLLAEAEADEQEGDGDGDDRAPRTEPAGSDLALDGR